MTYTASNQVTPLEASQGAVTYRNPYFKSSCGCGSGNVNGGMPMPARENFMANNMNANGNGNGNGMQPVAPPMAPLAPAHGGNAPMCTLTATAPPAGCCNPAPLHCSDSCGCGFFKASEAYGS